MRRVTLVLLALAALAIGQTWQLGPVTPFSYWRFDGEYFPGTNMVYFLGGRDAAGSTVGTVYSFDPVARTYATTGAAITTPISNYDICLLRDDYDPGAGDTWGLYIFGGRNSAGGFIPNVQVYYPRSNRVRTVTTDTFPGKIGTGTYMPGASVVYANKAWITGGFTSLVAPYLTNQTWCYDPLAPAGTRWTRITGADLPRTRAYPLAVVVGGFFYAMGGDTFDGSSLYARAQCWRLNLNSPGTGWTALPDMPVTNGESRAFGFDSLSPYGYAKCIITAGRGNWTYEDSLCHIFKIDSNVWRAFPVLNQTRRNHAGAMIPGMGSSNGVPGLWVWGGRYGSDTQIRTAPEFWQLQLVNDVGCTKIEVPTGTLDSGLAVTPACSVHNFGGTTVSYNVRFRIGTGYEFVAAVSGHAPGTTQYLTFPDWTALPRGSLAVTCSTELSADGIPTNDRQSGTVFVRVRDVGATAIVAPTGTVDSGSSVPPQATVHNYGNVAATVSIAFGIDDGYAEVISRTIEGEAESTFTFPAWTAIVRGPHVTKCTTDYADDLFPDNNLVTGSATVAVHDVAVSEIATPGAFVAPGPMTPQARLYNYGTERDAVTVTFLINSLTPYAETVTLPGGIPAGTDTIIDFPNWTAMVGSFTARCSTWAATDPIPDNDTLSRSFQVASVDAGVTTIIAPTGTVDTAVALIPSAKVKNLGEAAVSFMTYFRIDSTGGTAYLDSTVLTDLDVGVETTLVFAEWAKPHAIGSYTTCCSTALAGDNNPDNDARTGTLTIVARSAPSESGWARIRDIPLGAKGKKVKDGGALAYQEESLVGYVYAFKGNNRCEFYKYNTIENAWLTKESIPAIGSAGKKKAVKKGASLVATGGTIYGTKGNNTVEFWAYNPNPLDAYAWSQKADVPVGAKNIKEGSGAVVVGDYVYLLKGSGTTEFYRYNLTTNTWESRAAALLGTSGKAYKNGSTLTASEDGTTIYAVKGSYDEFFTYQVDSDRWTQKATLPLIGTIGKKKKLKDGAGLAYNAGSIFALKGGNTNEFWRYNADSDRWQQLPDMPEGEGRRVKGGGALIRAVPNLLYAFRGNNTPEFWKYGIPATADIQTLATGTRVQSGSSFRASHAAIHVSPNPFAVAATVSYSLPASGHINLKLYDITGKLVTVLAEGCQPAGHNAYSVERQALSSGIYILKLETESETATTKLVIE